MTKRQRGARESLASIALGLEAVVLFFATVTIRGLRPESESALILAGGAALIVVFAVVAGLQRHGWALWVGGALQVVLIALGVVNPFMYVVGVGFAALWAWCVWRGHTLDRQRLAAAEGADA